MKQDKILSMTLRTAQNLTLSGMKYGQGNIVQARGGEKRLVASLAKVGIVPQATHLAFQLALISFLTLKMLNAQILTRADQLSHPCGPLMATSAITKYFVKNTHKINKYF